MFNYFVLLMSDPQLWKHQLFMYLAIQNDTAVTDIKK